MALVTGTGAPVKNKAFKVVLSGFAGVANKTSTFGNGSDINCDNVEYTSLVLPEKAENNTETINTNLRDIKETSGTYEWDSWSGMEVFNDENLVNWKAFVAAQETEATGTVSIVKAADTSVVVGSWKAAVSKAGGGGGEATAFNTSFAPTFALIEAIAAST